MENSTDDFIDKCQNASASNITRELWLVQDPVSGYCLPLSLFFVTGLPWNLLVVWIIVKQKLYRQPTIILLRGALEQSPAEIAGMVSFPDQENMIE